MQPIEIVAQAVGIVAMAFNILSYQCKKQSTVIALQLFGGALFAANYLLLGATGYIAALVCMLLVVVAIIAGFTYYTSVALDQPFVRRFGEMALISIGVAVVSFFVGILAKKFLGVDL